MKRIAIIFAFFYWNTLYSDHKSFEIIFKNTTNQTVTIALEGRVDMYYTHNTKNLRSFIPNQDVVKAFVLSPGQEERLFITPTQTSTAILPHKENLALGNFESTHQTIRGTLIINSMEELYNFYTKLNTTENLLLTLSDQGLSLQAYRLLK